jgi:hypothetical protein
MNCGQIRGDAKSEAEKLGIWEKARQGAVYRLDDTILMNSRNRAAQEVTCSGPTVALVPRSYLPAILLNRQQQGSAWVSGSPLWVPRESTWRAVCTKYLNDFSYSEAFLVEGY